jgi:hypothetical protein
MWSEAGTCRNPRGSSAHGFVEASGIPFVNGGEDVNNKITMPTAGLKNLEIIETAFTWEQISALWFRQITGQNE